MDELKYKGRYVAAAVWGISSILFFNYVSHDWMKIWMKISLGILQVGALAYVTYNLYKLQYPKIKMLYVALCLDIIITILALIYFC